MNKSKIDQKYKGIRQIERRQLIPKKNIINPFQIYVHKKKIHPSHFVWWQSNKNPNVTYPIYKLIYQL